MTTADAWYSGNVAHAGHAPQRPRGNRIVEAFSRQTNRTPQTVSSELRIHVPIAADVAMVGADLLFGDAPSFTIPEAHQDTTAPTGAVSKAEAEAAEARLAEFAADDSWASTLLEGAEIAGALGGVYLRPIVDLELADHPILTVIHPDAAVPEFRNGRLVAVTFWRVLPGSDGDRGDVWRHLERHEKGSIEHGLYRGKADELGVRVDLAQREETIGLVVDVNAADPGLVNLQAVGIDRLLPRYVPNALPNRRKRTHPVGRADTAGVEDLMEAADTVWTSWVRDIRLAKARLIVPDEFLERTGRGQGAAFDPDREIFSPLEMDPAHMAKAGIELVQPEIRHEAHERTLLALFTQIVQTAGYSPQSFGLPGDGAQQTATEVDAREGRSVKTTGRKQEYWRRALQDVAHSMLALDRAFCGGTVTPVTPVVAYPDAAEADMRSTASTLNLINLANAASIETRVRILNPGWSGDQVKAEVERIKSEDGAMVADPTGGFS